MKTKFTCCLVTLLALLSFASGGLAEDAVATRAQDGVYAAGPGDGGTKSVTCVFPQAFGKAPTVTATALSEVGSDFDDVFCLTVRRVTTTNFVVNIYRVDKTGGEWGQNLRVAWHAAE